MSIVVIYGPPGSGKTLNCEALRRAYNCRRVVDGWGPGIPLVDGDLALTNVAPPYPGVRGARVVSIGSALSREQPPAR